MMLLLIMWAILLCIMITLLVCKKKEAKRYERIIREDDKYIGHLQNKIEHLEYKLKVLQDKSNRGK